MGTAWYVTSSMSVYGMSVDELGWVGVGAAFRAAITAHLALTTATSGVTVSILGTTAMNTTTVTPSVCSVQVSVLLHAAGPKIDL